MKRIYTSLLLLFVSLASCAVAPKPQWTPVEIPLCSTMRLWEISRLAMTKNGFPVVHIGFDPKTKEAISGWQKDLHPFKGHGFRERVHVRYKAGENAGTLILGVRVESQVNENLAHPLDASYADWVESADNTARAKVILQYIRSLLGDRLNIGKSLSPEELKRREEGFKPPLKGGRPNE